MTSGPPSGPPSDPPVGVPDDPCGLLTLALDGTVLDANRTFLRWVGRDAADLGRMRLHDVLLVGARIFWETHLAPLLHVEGRLDEVALELRGPQGRRPVLLSALAADGRVRVAVSSAAERVRYERELRAARAAAERSAREVGALQAATAALSDAVGVDAVVDALLDAATGPLGGAGATVWLADDEGVLHARRSRGEEPPDAPAPQALLRSAPAGPDGGRLAVALHGHVALRGALSVAPSADPGAEPPDEDLLGAVGRQGGLALDRAQLFDRTADVAHALQQSLLAVDPPVDPRFAVAGLYRPGVALLEVGGDFYDVFSPRPGTLVVVVGDVVGRGLAAASAMGQLRSAVRALADVGGGPARLLERLDRFVEHVEAASLATLVWAEVDLGTGAVRYACAGHLPPLLQPAGAPERLVWGGRSTPLGAYGQGQRAEDGFTLAPGDRLLLYTDGLVERRDRPLDDRFDELAAALAATRDRPPATALEALTAELLEGATTRDDVCALLLHWQGGGHGSSQGAAG